MVCVVGIGVYVSAISGHVPLFFFYRVKKRLLSTLPIIKPK